MTGLSTVVGLLGGALFLGGAVVAYVNLRRVTGNIEAGTSRVSQRAQRRMIRAIGVWQIGVGLLVLHLGGYLGGVIPLFGMGLFMVLAYPWIMLTTIHRK